MWKSKQLSKDNSYQLPSNNNQYLLLSAFKEATLINPNSVESINFKEAISSQLWIAELSTEQEVYRLLFSDKKKWETAQVELKTLPLNKVLD